MKENLMNSEEKVELKSVDENELRQAKLKYYETRSKFVTYLKKLILVLVLLGFSVFIAIMAYEIRVMQDEIGVIRRQLEANDRYILALKNSTDSMATIRSELNRTLYEKVAEFSIKLNHNQIKATEMDASISTLKCRSS